MDWKRGETGYTPNVSLRIGYFFDFVSMPPGLIVKAFLGLPYIF